MGLLGTEALCNIQIAILLDWCLKELIFRQKTSDESARGFELITTVSWFTTAGLVG